jgi:hypothetical protein
MGGYRRGVAGLSGLRGGLNACGPTVKNGAETLLESRLSPLLLSVPYYPYYILLSPVPIFYSKYYFKIQVSGVIYIKRDFLAIVLCVLLKDFFATLIAL